MNRIKKIIAVFFSLIFFAFGIGWLAVPQSIAARLGMPLLSGVGLSTQIGDMTSFFLTLGITILMALITGKRIWYYPSILLLGLAAVSRCLAWLLHSADFTVNMIIFEGLVACVLFWVSRNPNKKKSYVG